MPDILPLYQKTILMFCPEFFGYEREIKKGLENLGAEVIWFDDRPSNSFCSKLLIRINKGLLAYKIEDYYNHIFESLSGKTLDYLFLVNPESISVRSLTKLRTAYPKAKSILYMWDSLRNRKRNIELLHLFDSKFTFDPRDALGYKLSFRPLFYSEIYTTARDAEKIYDLLFLGTAHSDRYLFVKKLSNKLFGRKLKLYFYLNSRLLFILKKVFDREFRSVKFSDISFKSLTHLEVSNLMFQSVAILDINHPKQTGLTMRTMEALGAGCKLITTNKDIVNYDLYQSSNILVIDRDSPEVDLNFFISPFVNPDEKVLHKYSIGGWLREIFEI